MNAIDLTLRLAAIGQLAIAILNFNLERLLHWEDEVARMPLLLREVHRIHGWFISLTLMIFAVFTWRFAEAMSVSEPCRWMAGLIGGFWGIRTVMQVSYYSSSHWRGNLQRTCVHFILLIAYGGLTVTYLLAAGGWPGRQHL